MEYYLFVIPKQYYDISNASSCHSDRSTCHFDRPPVISTVGRNLHGVKNLKDLSSLTAVRDDKLYNAVRDDIF